MIEKVKLFDRASLFLFLALTSLLFSFNLLVSYHSFSKMREFNTFESDAKVLSQSLRAKENKSYYILKLKLDNGSIAYIKGSKLLRDLVGRHIRVRLFIKEVTFIDFMRGRFYPAYISHVYRDKSAQYSVATRIASEHSNKEIGALYATLYCATTLPKTIREKVSYLGISHLVAISGYHLSLLSLFLFALLKYPYSTIQARYFPFRSRNRDIFVMSASVIFLYAYFLDFTPSVTRSISMLFIGYFLYDRGIKLFSLQTLFLTAVILIALFPPLLFSIGFWLSILGVFYLLLLLKHFEGLHVIALFVLLHIWVYLAMLPISLYIFETFSLYHPFSILLTMVFNLFYPLSIVAHLVGQGEIFDSLLVQLLSLHVKPIEISVSGYFIGIYAIVSLLGIYYRGALLIILFMSTGLFFIK